MLTIVIGGSFIAYWYTVTVPELEKIPKDYERYSQFFGSDKIVPEFGADFGKEERLIRNSEESVIEEYDNMLVIHAEIKSGHNLSGEAIFHAVDEYKIDRITKKHIDSGLYYAFPTDVEKKSYDFWHPIIHRPTTLDFVGVKTIKDMETYVFECAHATNDNTKAFPQYSDKRIFVNYNCILMVEPRTGNLINMELSWYNFFVNEQGERITDLQEGGVDSTEFFTAEAILHTKSELDNWDMYQRVIPSFMISVIVLIIVIEFVLGKLFLEKIQSSLKIEKEKNEFSKMISHELKSPLVPIRGYCEMLLDQNMMGPINETQKRALQKIYNDSEHLLDLIRKLLSAQKLDSESFEPNIEDVYIDNLFDQITTSYTKIVQDKKAKIIVSPAEHIKIRCDEYLIMQVFSNILTNATDFIPEETGFIEIKYELKEDFVEFSVSNNGPKIDEESIQKIFKKYYQADTSLVRPHGGSGLGLAICKSIIEAHGGRIWANSNDEITTFSFIIPK